MSFATDNSTYPSYSFTITGTVLAPPPSIQYLDDSASQGFALGGSWSSDGNGFTAEVVDFPTTADGAEG